MAPIKTQSTSRSERTSIWLALANAAITTLILASPIGIGDGNGMIGYSVYRMLIMICPQSILAIAGIIAAFRAMTKQQSWIPGLALNALVMVAAFFLYFAQSQTIERFL
jgi:hypothetical protein